MTFPISNFLDFYLLETIQHFVSSDPDAEFRHSKHRLLRDVELELALLSRDFACALHDYIFLACVGEARHAYDHIPVVLNALNYNVSRQNAYEIATQYSPESYPVLVDMFDRDDWHGGGFGGKFWASVARSLEMVYVRHVPDKVFVDYCADLKHNNGLIFDKPVVIENDLDTSSLESLLNDKRDAEDFCATACKRQSSDSHIYECQFIHFRTSQLVKRYMRLYKSKDVEFYGCKPDIVYEPIEFGDETLELIENSHIAHCHDCGEVLADDDTYYYHGSKHCYDCYSNHKPEDEEVEQPKQYCDACGKERTSTNQYILDGKSMCHACYNDAVNKMNLVDDLYNFITSSVVHK